MAGIARNHDPSAKPPQREARRRQASDDSELMLFHGGMGFRRHAHEHAVLLDVMMRQRRSRMDEGDDHQEIGHEAMPHGEDGARLLVAQGRQAGHLQGLAAREGVGDAERDGEEHQA